MKKTYEVILKKFRDENKENARQQEQLEKTLKTRDRDLQDVIKIAEEAKRAKSEVEDDCYNFKTSAKSKAVKAKSGSTISSSNIDSSQGSQSVAAYLYPELKPVLAYVKEETGMTNFEEIVSKMERHSETISTLKDL